MQKILCALLSTFLLIRSTTIPINPVDIRDIPQDSIICSTFSNDELELMTLITSVEACGECEEGKRLVIDTILNRLDRPEFPDNITDVITNAYAYELTYLYDVDDEIYRLVLEEIRNRTNYDVIYFTSEGYSVYGTPLFKVGGHWFSSI